MATTRVYILAKELGVKSTAIVEKCQDEGLDVKNHMAVISAGLAATIREWFSEGENVTTVETAEKVDLKKVRIPKKPKRKLPEAKPQKVIQAEPVAAPAEVIEAEQSRQEAVAVATTEVVEVGEVSAVAVKEQPPATQQVTVEPKKPEPEPILPAGPILEKPEPARLTGPQVVRIEAPEPAYQPRTKPKDRYDLPITEPLMYDQEEELAPVSIKGKKRPPKQVKEKTRGHRRGEIEFEAVKRPKFGGKWRQRDIDERQARLTAASAEGLRLRPLRKIAAKPRRDVAVVVRPQRAVVNEPITVKGLSAALAVKTSDVVSKLMQHNVMATANHVISSDLAELIAVEFDTELVVEHRSIP